MKKTEETFGKHLPVLHSSGRLPYRMTNDYLFRAVFQSRPKALEGLCRSVLRLPEKDRLSVTLKNPIELGREIGDKEFLLDLALLINSSMFLNLEMQVYRDKFWPERSLSYTCRSYDSLNHGKGYDMVLPVLHVGFLDYTLFPKHPEFFAEYRLANIKKHQVYSDKLRISVIDLTQEKLATKEDRACGLDLWARVFKASTWEEINMLAQKNDYLQETVSGIAQLTEEEKIRQHCQAREDFDYWERIKALTHQRELQEREDVIRQQNEDLQKAQDEIAHLRAELEALKRQNR